MAPSSMWKSRASVEHTCQPSAPTKHGSSSLPLSDVWPESMVRLCDASGSTPRGDTRRLAASAM